MTSYKKGYVAFLDILGFSNFIENADPDSVEKLFNFIEKLKTLFNSNTGIEMDFFSDSIILMTDTHELSSFLFPIYLAESYLTKELGLLFSGAMTSGEYYQQEPFAADHVLGVRYVVEKVSRAVIDERYADADSEHLERDVGHEYKGDRAFDRKK